MAVVAVGVCLILFGLLVLWFCEAKGNMPLGTIAIGVLIGVATIVIGFSSIVGSVIYTCFTRGVNGF